MLDHMHPHHNSVIHGWLRLAECCQRTAWSVWFDIYCILSQVLMAVDRFWISRLRRLATIWHQPHTLTDGFSQYYFQPLAPGLNLLTPQTSFLMYLQRGHHWKHHFQVFLHCCVHILLRDGSGISSVFTQPLPNSGCFSVTLVIAVRSHMTILRPFFYYFSSLECWD
jgi:hypothetical protein